MELAASLDFSSSPSPSPLLPSVDQQQHQQQEELLLKGAHNLQLHQVATPESRALYAACSSEEGALGLAKVCETREPRFTN